MSVQWLPVSIFILRFRWCRIPKVSPYACFPAPRFLCTYPGAAAPAWSSFKLCPFPYSFRRGDEGLSWSWGQEWGMGHGKVAVAGQERGAETEGDDGGRGGGTLGR